MRGQNRMEESFAKSWLCYKSVRKYGRLARMLACRSYYPSAKDGNWYVWLRRHSSRKSIMPWACCMHQPSWSNEPQHHGHIMSKIIWKLPVFICLFVWEGVVIHMASSTLVKKMDHALGLLHATTILEQWAAALRVYICQKSSRNYGFFFVCFRQQKIVREHLQITFAFFSIF